MILAVRLWVSSRDRNYECCWTRHFPDKEAVLK